MFRSLRSLPLITTLFALGFAALVAIGGVPSDIDQDGVPDAMDNCLLVPNGPELGTGNCFAQEDGDMDGYGNPCDTDIDLDYGTTLIDVSQVLTASQQVSSDPAYDFDCDGGTTLIDLSIALTDAVNVTPPGPSGYACAGTVPCP